MERFSNRIVSPFIGLFFVGAKVRKKREIQKDRQREITLLLSQCLINIINTPIKIATRIILILSRSCNIYYNDYVKYNAFKKW